MEIIQLLGSLMGLAFVSGINLYATILAIGLGLRLDLIHLAPDLAALGVLGHPYVVAAAAIAYSFEFFADKIPWVDSLWDSFHTFIRPVGAAILGATAIGNVDPVAELLVILLCGGIALTSHATKAGFRLVVNQIPEPFSNIAVSVTEDVAALTGTWLSLQHPTFMFVWTVGFLVLFIFLFPRLLRLLRLEFLAISARLKTLFAGNNKEVSCFDDIPEKYLEEIPEGMEKRENNFCIRAVSGKGVELGRNLYGLLGLDQGRFFFVTRKGFRNRAFEVDLAEIKKVTFQKKFLLDRLMITTGKKYMNFLFLKTGNDRGEKIASLIRLQIPESSEHP